MSKQDKVVTYLYTESMEWQVEEWGEVEVCHRQVRSPVEACSISCEVSCYGAGTSARWSLEEEASP